MQLFLAAPAITPAPPASLIAVDAKADELFAAMLDGYAQRLHSKSFAVSYIDEQLKSFALFARRARNAWHHFWTAPGATRVDIKTYS